MNDPLYVSGTNEAGAQGSGEGEAGEDGYVFITGTKLVQVQLLYLEPFAGSTSVPGPLGL